MSLKLVYEKRFFKDLDRIPNADVERIISAVKSLSLDPMSPGSKKLKAKGSLYRIRQGDFRIVYEFWPALHEVRILFVRHRKDSYKDIP